MRGINPEEEYFVSFSRTTGCVFRDDVEEDKIRVEISRQSRKQTNGRMVVSVNIGRYIQNNRDIINGNLQSLLEFSGNERVPSGRCVNEVSLLEEVLFGTVEGQELLERLLHEFSSWDQFTLSLPTLERNSEEDIVWCMDYSYLLENEEKKWESAEESMFEEVRESAPLKEYFDHWVFDQEQKVSYAIRLVDEYMKEWVYVGDSTNVLGRLQTHVSQDGDFAVAKRNNMVVAEVLEVSKQLSEVELYNKYVEKSDVPETRVCGGR